MKDRTHAYLISSTGKQSALAEGGRASVQHFASYVWTSCFLLQFFDLTLKYLETQNIILIVVL